MLAPEDVKSIVDALEQLDWVQWVKGSMQAEQGDGIGDDDLGEGGPPVAGEAAGDLAPPVAAPAAPPAPMGGPPAAAAMGGPPAAPPTPPAAPKPPVDKNAAGMKPYAAGATASSSLKIGGKADGFSGKTAGNPGIKNYGAGVPEGKVEGATNEPAQGEVVETAIAGDPASSYQSAGGQGGQELAVKYSRLQAEVQHLRGQLQALSQANEAERSARVNAERYSLLAEKNRAFVFDLDTEVERCKYGKMTEETFAVHLEAMENYRPNFTGQDFIPSIRQLEPVQARNGAAGPVARYSQEHSDRARHICEEACMKGEKPNYEEVLQKVHAGAL